MFVFPLRFHCSSFLSIIYLFVFDFCVGFYFSFVLISQSLMRLLVGCCPCFVFLSANYLFEHGNDDEDELPASGGGGAGGGGGEGGEGEGSEGGGH